MLNFSCRWGATHRRIDELYPYRTPQILFQIYFACWLYFIPVSNPILSSEIALAIHYSRNKLRKFVATNLEVKQEGRFIF